jgi:hypothetical protein
MCPWSLVIGGTRDRLLELVVRPAQRYRATGSPDFAIDKYGGTTRRRRLSCAEDHGGAGAILGKGFDLPNHRYESALVELADAANGVARHTAIQAWIIRRSCLSVGGEPLLDREIVASTVKHRKPSIPATNWDGLPVVRISTSGRGVMTAKCAAAITISLHTSETACATSTPVTARPFRRATAPCRRPACVRLRQAAQIPTGRPGNSGPPTPRIDRFGERERLSRSGRISGKAARCACRRRCDDRWDATDVVMSLQSPASSNPGLR